MALPDTDNPEIHAPDPKLAALTLAASRGRGGNARPTRRSGVPPPVSEVHGTFSQVREAAAPPLRPVVDFLRRRIAELDKARVEVVWPRQAIASFGVGPRKMTQHYAYIGVHRSHVNLGFYHGASLRDPAGLLEGTGRRLRHVKIGGMADARRPAIRALLLQAIADRGRYRDGA